MKSTRLIGEPIIGILAEHDAGAKCADLYHKKGMLKGTFYSWKAHFGGMTVLEAKQLKALEDERAKLLRIFGLSVACRNDGPATSSGLIERWSAMDFNARGIPRYAGGSGTWLRAAGECLTCADRSNTDRAPVAAG